MKVRASTKKICPKCKIEYAPVREKLPRDFACDDGAMLGRVGPKSEIRMDGLASGYYRLYARSRYGTFAWGPRDQYIPGAMTVELP